MSKTQNIRIEKKTTRRLGPKLVPIDSFVTNKVIDTLIKCRDEVKQILVIIEDKAGSGHVMSNMTDHDSFYFFERYKSIRLK